MTVTRSTASSSRGFSPSGRVFDFDVEIPSTSFAFNGGSSPSTSAATSGQRRILTPRSVRSRDPSPVPTASTSSSHSPRLTPSSTGIGSGDENGLLVSGQSTPRRDGKSPSEEGQTTPSFQFSFTPRGSSHTSEGDLSTPSSQPVFTPRGSSLASENGTASILPSVERDDATSVTPSRPRMTTPSISLSPPPTASERDVSTPAPSTPRQDRSQSSLVGGLDGLALSDRDIRPSNAMGMSSMTEAINNVASGHDRSREINLSRLSEPPPMPSTPQSPGGPHDVRSEEPPEGRFNAVEIQQALVDSTGLMKRLAGVLRGNSLREAEGSTIGRLYQEAQRLADFKVQATRTIGFVGDSGVGKSRLLNSLLDFNDLARTSNSGGACTCVATEYHYHARDDFAIEVDLFKPDEVKEQVTSLLHVYRQHHLSGDAKSSSNENNSIHKVAESTFHTLFGARRASKGFLCGDNVDAVISDLHGWIDQGYPWDMVGNVREISSKKDCSDELMRLTSPTNDSEDLSQRTAKWPYIRRVKVYLNSHILSNGLVLVDLPGLRDINAARVAVTERHLQRCNEIFAVSKIGRAQTDMGVESVFEHARRAKLSNVGIICTHSDAIEAHEAMRDWTGKVGQRVQILSEAVAELTQQSEQIDGENPEDMDEEAAISLLRRSRKTREQLRMAKLELKRFLVTTRNHNVTRTLKKTYDKRALDGNVNVFCVSNTLYKDWRKQPQTRSADWLQLSGIIGLRRHGLALTMESQMRSLTNYVSTDIPALLSDLELWVQSGAESGDVEQKRKIREALDELEQGINDMYQTESPLMEATLLLNEAYKEKIYQRRATRTWQREASQAAASWARLRHPSYSSFCQQLGEHKTKTVGYRNWNQEAIEGMLRDIENPWGQVLEVVKDMQNTIEEDANAFKMSQGAEMRQAFGGNVTQLKSIQRSMQSREQNFLIELGKVWSRYNSDIRELQTRAFSGACCSIIVSLLTSAYDECNADYGDGSDSRRKRTMTSAVANERLFEDIMLQAQKLFHDAGAKLQLELDKCLNDFQSGLSETLDLVREDNAAMENEQDPEFRDLLEETTADISEQMRILKEVVCR